MWFIPLHTAIIGLTVYLAFSTLYLLVLAVVHFVVAKPSQVAASKRLNRFAIVVPAHNEELLVSHLCESLLSINYPGRLYEVFVVVDNSVDRTAEICGTYPVNVLVRKDPSKLGKGFALRWAFQQVPLETFDAILIVDADNVVDAQILTELNKLIESGEQAIQCYNGVGNRLESWFTQILYVSRLISNVLYHDSKHKLGLSSYLMGNGICFSTGLLARKGWTAFTIGEDWEYYAQLIRDRIRIGFAVQAKVYHQESKSLDQATSQRLRWSSGRFRISRTLGLQLLLQGIKSKDWFTLDAAMPLVLPNYSLQINLTVLTLGACFLLPSGGPQKVLALANVASLLGDCFLFAMGMYLAGDYWKVLRSVLKVPCFLLWKLVIDFVSFTGLYRGDRWVRTQRHIPLEKPRSS